MPSPQGPLLPRRRLGAELKRLRGDRTLDEVAAETLISTSKLSRLENGQGVPQPRDIRDLINFYGAERGRGRPHQTLINDGRRQAWWREYSDVLSDSLDVFIDYESGSFAHPHLHADGIALLSCRRGVTRPGLMSTVYPHRTPEEVDKLVEVRLRRQQILTDDEKTPHACRPWSTRLRCGAHWP